VVRPYGASGANQVIFDGGLPLFRQANNDAWELVPPSADGVPGEWRSKVSLAVNGERYGWGQLMSSKLRLISCAELGDLRAQNESYLRVPLADPRPALGPLLARPTHKIPLVYLSPGLHFVFDDASEASGRIHIRLAPTHFGAAGVSDYAGETNPNQLALSIARSEVVALDVRARHIVFEHGHMNRSCPPRYR
jgi:hypothetical protein